MRALRVRTSALRVLVRAVAFLLAIGFTTATADDIAKHAVWITGEVFTENSVLLFRTDKPVSGNTAGNVGLLGATKQTMNVFLPAYMKAAEKRMTLRLYGVLVPVPAPFSKASPDAKRSIHHMEDAPPKRS